MPNYNTDGLFFYQLIGNYGLKIYSINGILCIYIPQNFTFIFKKLGGIMSLIEMSKEQMIDNIQLREGYEKYMRIGQELLYLSRQDCEATGVSPQEFLDATEAIMIEYSKENLEMPAKIGIHPLPDALLHAMPAFLPSQHACGMKWVSQYPSNRDMAGFIPTNSQLIYNDTLTGVALSFMDASWITEMRTPATALVGIKHGANLKAKTFGMLGCGLQGKANVKMIELVLKELEEIYIYDISKEAMTTLVALCQPYVNAKIIIASSYEEVARKSEVIVSAMPLTRDLNPPIKDQWIMEGSTLVMLDCHTAFEDKTMKRASKYYCDSISQHRLLEEYGYYPSGLPSITGETGSLAGKTVTGREDSKELVVINNIGMACEDIACAKLIFESALTMGIGIKLPLWSSTNTSL